MPLVGGEVGPFGPFGALCPSPAAPPEEVATLDGF